LRKKLSILMIIAFFIFSGCRQNPPPGDSSGLGSQEKAAENQASTEASNAHKDEHEGEGHEHEDVIVSPEKQTEWGISVGSPALQTISSEISLPGILTLNQNRTAHISSLAHGQVSALHADLGMKVKKGQALLVLNSPEFAQAQADFLEARAKVNLSRVEYDRAEMLLKSHAIEEKAFLRREAEYQKLSTEYGALGSKLHSFGITHAQIDKLIEKCEGLKDAKYKCEMADPHLPILSPLSGRVIFRDVILGDHIEPDKILFTVSDLDTLWAVLDAYEKDIPMLSKESKVVIVSPLFPDKEFSGRITYIHDLVDEKLRTVKIRIEVNNKSELLKPNMYIRGFVKNIHEGGSLLSVPEQAVQNFEGGKIVFLQEKPDTFHVQHVKLGKKVNNRRIILSGLTRQSRIVTKGAFFLKAEMGKSSFGHVHVH